VRGYAGNGKSSIFDRKSETVRRPTGPGSGCENRRAVSCSMGRAVEGGEASVVNIAMKANSVLSCGYGKI
jgi:hypothetical protein